MSNGMQWEDLVANEPHLSSLPPTLASTLVRELQGARGLSKVKVTSQERLCSNMPQLFVKESKDACWEESHISVLIFVLCSRERVWWGGRQVHDNLEGEAAVLTHSPFSPFSRLLSPSWTSSWRWTGLLLIYIVCKSSIRCWHCTGRGKGGTQILWDAWLSHQRKNWRRWLTFCRKSKKFFDNAMIRIIFNLTRWFLQLTLL